MRAHVVDAGTLGVIKKNEMKNVIAIILIFISNSPSFCQIPIDPCELCYTEFELEIDSTYKYWSLDTTNQNNIWMYGKANKILFNEGSSVIITDTVNNYPLNNTSSFELTWLCDYDYDCPGIGTFDGFSFGFHHKMDSEEGKDGGKIEISINESPFRNIIDLQDTIQFWGYTQSDSVKSLNGPGFSGSIEDWSWSEFGSGFHLFVDGIPVKIRFTFESDSVETNQEGWMIGQIQASWFFLNTEEINPNDLIKISPNPARNEIILKMENSEIKKFELFDNYGKKIIEGNTNGVETRINIRDFPSGFYILKIEGKEKYYFTKKIIKI